MRTKTFLTAFISLILSLGLYATAGATPKDSQRLRGMADRVFYVQVEVTSTLIPGDTGPEGTVFENCYFFNNGGVWIDPPFGVPGMWVQNSNGAATTYTAFAIDGALAVLQEGSVTPAKGRGVLQLEAFSSLVFSEFVLAEFFSVGYEVDECPL